MFAFDVVVEIGPIRRRILAGCFMHLWSIELPIFGAPLNRHQQAANLDHLGRTHSRLPTFQPWFRYPAPFDFGVDAAYLVELGHELGMHDLIMLLCGQMRKSGDEVWALNSPRNPAFTQSVHMSSTVI